MSFFTFVIYVLIAYAIYYLLNIAYDLSRKETNTVSIDNEKSIDIQQVFIEEKQIPIDASLLISEPADVAYELPANSTIARTGPASTESIQETSDIDLFSTEERQKSITNITNHNGYTTTSLTALFKEVIHDGYNPFKCVTAKMT